MKWPKNEKNRSIYAQEGGYNVTPALAEYGIAKKLMEGGSEKLTALDIIKCALGLIFFVAVCYYGGTQYGR